MYTDMRRRGVAAEGGGPKLGTMPTHGGSGASYFTQCLVNTSKPLIMVGKLESGSGARVILIVGPITSTGSMVTTRDLPHSNAMLEFS